MREKEGVVGWVKRRNGVGRGRMDKEEKEKWCWVKGAGNTREFYVTQ